MIRVALCPLSFAPQTLREHIVYKGNAQSVASVKKDKALEYLEVGEPIDEWRSFKYWNKSNNRSIGSVNVKAPYGMAPHDFDFIVGLYNYCRDLHRAGLLPEDGELSLRLPEMAEMCHLKVSGGKQADRLRSTIFRLNFFSQHSTAEWSAEEGDHGHKTIKLFTLKYLSRLGKAKGAAKNHERIVLQLDGSFIDLVKSHRVIQFDRDYFDTLSAKHKRHYLQCVRWGYWERNSPPDINAEEYAINQIWMTDKDDQLKRAGKAVEAKQRRSAHRIDWTKRLCKEAEQLGYLEPTKKSGWHGEYIKSVPQKGTGTVHFVRWKSSKLINNKKERKSKSKLSGDPLWNRASVLRDEQGEAPTPETFHQWQEKYGRERMRRHIDVLEWMIENKKGFKKSALQTLVNRMEQDYSAPDEYREQTQMNMFADTESSRDPRLQKAYDTIIKH